MRNRLLRLFLAASALAWGASITGVVLPWPQAVQALQGLGAGPVPNDPMLDYWLRMASGAFALVGLVYLALAIWPARFAAVIPIMGGLMVAEGCILLIHGARLRLPPMPFYFDTAACFVLGAAIWLCRPQPGDRCDVPQS